MKKKYLIIMLLLLLVPLITAHNSNFEKLTITEKVKKELINTHNNNDNEVMWCVDGKNNGGEYTITSIKRMHLKESSPNHLIYTKDCRKDAQIHTHPILNDCWFSTKDILDYGKNKYKNDHLFTGIVCQLGEKKVLVWMQQKDDYSVRKSLIYLD